MRSRLGYDDFPRASAGGIAFYGFTRRGPADEIDGPQEHEHLVLGPLGGDRQGT